MSPEVNGAIRLGLVIVRFQGPRIRFALVMERMSMATPSVSVIITAYNAAATIGDAVRSALSQAETAQVIVVDDVSRDQTVERAEEAAGGDPRLLVIRRARNGGPAAARNDGLDAVTGSVLAVLDADDFLLPGRFARLLALPDWTWLPTTSCSSPKRPRPQPFRRCRPATISA